MLLNPQVSLLVVAPPTPEIPVQALARVTILGLAEQCTDSTPGHAEAKAAYMARYPQSIQMFSFSDFSLFTIEPSAIRFVGGFAQATSIAPETFSRVLRES
jgi:putative heme iron utilization protein